MFFVSLKAPRLTKGATKQLDWHRGKNDYSQLGDGSTTNRNTPWPVSGSIAWAQISVGAMLTCGIRQDNGRAMCFGMCFRVCCRLGLAMCGA